MTEPAGADTADLITLPARCGISTACELAAAGTALEPGGKLRIGAAAVARMSGAAVFALISVARTIAPDGGKVVIYAPSAQFTDAFADLGLFEFLMKMEFAE